MSKLFVKILFVVMTAVMVVTACSTASETPTAYSNPSTATQPPAYVDPSSATNAPAATEPPAASGTISFATDILPILESRCINCHGGDRTEKGLDLKSYASLMNGSERGPVIVAGDAANSTLANLISSGKMPKRGPKLTPEQVQLIIDWINQGALNN
ncbi:MAG: c-type cytochrome [Chloroflexi bacterium]|nr:c-type cytochrome [Chloroflexota bacterium]